MKVLLGIDHDKLAEFKYLCKFTAHRVLEMLCFCLCHLTTREVKHFLTAMTLHQNRRSVLWIAKNTSFTGKKTFLYHSISDLMINFTSVMWHHCLVDVNDILCHLSQGTVGGNKQWGLEYKGLIKMPLYEKLQLGTKLAMAYNADVTCHRMPCYVSTVGCEACHSQVARGRCHPNGM